MKEIHPFLPKSNGDLEENGRNEWKMKEIPPFLSQFNENLEENGRKRYKDEAIAHENEKIRAKTGEQKMFSPEMAVKMLKRKKKWAKETWTKELSPIIY